MTLQQLAARATMRSSFFDHQADTLRFWRDRDDAAAVTLPEEVVARLIAGSNNVREKAEKAQPRRLARLLLMKFLGS